MSKTKSTSRCRKWQLTINNPMEHEMEHKAIKEILNTFPSLVYWCMGDEIGNDTNTYHTHIYMYAKHPIRFTTLKNKFPMTRRCEDANIDVKSIHAIRRTISSHLRTILPIASVASLLGHLEETNEKHYNYDILTQKIKLECVTQMYETYQVNNSHLE